jgi:hypothetical protein
MKAYMLTLYSNPGKLIGKLIRRSIKEVDRQARKMPPPLEITAGALLIAIP